MKVKNFKELYIELHKMGFCISINSNGTMIDEEVIEWLKKYPPMRINMTLYGASDETYERLCNNPKGFTQVTKALSLLKENNIQVKLNCSVTPYNKDDLRKMMKFAQDKNMLKSFVGKGAEALNKAGKYIHGKAETVVSNIVTKRTGVYQYDKPMFKQLFQSFFKAK